MRKNWGSSEFCNRTDWIDGVAAAKSWTSWIMLNVIQYLTVCARGLSRLMETNMFTFVGRRGTSQRFVCLMCPKIEMHIQRLGFYLSCYIIDIVDLYFIIFIWFNIRPFQKNVYILYLLLMCPKVNYIYHRITLKMFHKKNPQFVWDSILFYLCALHLWWALVYVEVAELSNFEISQWGGGSTAKRDHSS